MDELRGAFRGMPVLARTSCLFALASAAAAGLGCPALALATALLTLTSVVQHGVLRRRRGAVKWVDRAYAAALTTAATWVALAKGATAAGACGLAAMATYAAAKAAGALGRPKLGLALHAGVHAVGALGFVLLAAASRRGELDLSLESLGPLQAVRRVASAGLVREGAAATAAFVAARAAYDALLAPRLRSVPAPVRAHLWHLAASLYMVARLAHVYQLRPGAFRVAACPAPAPAAAAAPRHDALLDSYMLLEIARDAANLLHDAASGAVLGGPVMLAHHAASIALTSLALAKDVTCLGINVMPYMALTNPLQHATKALHAAAPGSRAASAAFAAFAASFAALRVVAFPALFVRPFALEAPRLMPEGHRAALALLLVLYAMQLHWARKMARIAAGAGRARRA